MTDEPTSEAKTPANQNDPDQIPNGFGPKTWGRWSAILVLPYGLFLVAGLMGDGPSFLRFLPVLGLVPLGFGAYRTLNKMSGGLRLLSGAWGLMAGLVLAPIFRGMATGVGAAPLFWLLSGLAILGLSLTVLHKEK